MSIFRQYYGVTIPFSEWTGKAELYCERNGVMYQYQTNTVRVYAHISKVKKVLEITNNKLISA